MENNPPKKAQVTFSGATPMKITDEIEREIIGLNDEQKAIVQQVGKTVKAYRNTAEELLKGKYSQIQGWAPVHLADPGDILAVSCPDGVVIRFERKTGEKRVMSAWMPETLPSVAALLSQNLIHCHSERNYISTVPTTGTEIKLSASDPIKKTTKDIVAFKIGFDSVIERPTQLPQPPQKPYWLLSVRNNFEINLVAEMAGEEKTSSDGKRILVRNGIRLPVGWECIEIFPFFDIEQWKPKVDPFVKTQFGQK